MQKIVYAMHLPESHKLIAEQIESEKPDIYLDEVPGVLDQDYDEFLSHQRITTDELQKRISEKGWRVDLKEKGLDKILESLRRNMVLRAGVESLEALIEYQKFQNDEIIQLLFGLSMDKSQYIASQRLRGQKGFFSIDLDIFFEDPVKLKAKIEEKTKSLAEKLRTFAEKEINRDLYMAGRIKELAQPNMLAYFGLSHRTISHLLERDGLKIPYEIVGEVALDPEEKLTLLLKYELLGLDPSELRSDDVNRDCDPAKKDFYLDLAADFFGFEDLNKKNFDHIALVNDFWKNLERITGRKIKSN